MREAHVIGRHISVISGCLGFEPVLDPPNPDDFLLPGEGYITRRDEGRRLSVNERSVVDRICLTGPAAGQAPVYRGPLPGGLTVFSSRQEVHAALGPPAVTTPPEGEHIYSELKAAGAPDAEIADEVENLRSDAWRLAGLVARFWFDAAGALESLQLSAWMPDALSGKGQEEPLPLPCLPDPQAPPGYADDPGADDLGGPSAVPLALEAGLVGRHIPYVLARLGPAVRHPDRYDSDEGGDVRVLALPDIGVEILCGRHSDLADSIVLHGPPAIQEAADEAAEDETGPAPAIAPGAFQPYRGPLPGGVAFGMPRAQVREALGAPIPTWDDMPDEDTYLFEGVALVCGHTRRSDVLASITLTSWREEMTEEDAPPAPPAPPPKRPGFLARLFGRS